MTLESGGGGGGGTSTTYTSNIPEWLRPQTEALLGAATQEYFTTEKGEDGTYNITGVKPYTPYSTDPSAYFAPFTPQQQQVFGETSGMQTPGGFAQGAGLATTAGLGSLGYGQQAAGMGGLYERMATDPGSMQGYMSPYMQNVVERQKLAAIEDAQRANLGANLGAVRQGTYGGARQALMQGQREAALEKQMGDIQAQGLQSAFEKAQQAQQFGAGLGLQGLQTGLQGLGQAGQMGRSLADISAQQQQADVQRLEFQQKMASLPQEQQQQIINQAVQNFALAQESPFQRLAQYSGLLRGYATPTMTAESYRSGPSAAQSLVGLGTTLYGASMPGKKKGGVIEEGIDTLAIKKAKRKKVAK
jgi:hypothetical protein